MGSVGPKSGLTVFKALLQDERRPGVRELSDAFIVSAPPSLGLARRKL